MLHTTNANYVASLHLLDRAKYSRWSTFSSSLFGTWVLWHWCKSPLFPPSTSLQVVNVGSTQRRADLPTQPRWCRAFITFDMLRLDMVQSISRSRPPLRRRTHAHHARSILFCIINLPPRFLFHPPYQGSIYKSSNWCPLILVYALYNRNKPLLYFLLVLLGCHIVGHNVLLGIAVPQAVFTTDTYPSNLKVGLCIAIRTPRLFSYIWCVVCTYLQTSFFTLCLCLWWGILLGYRQLQSKASYSPLSLLKPLKPRRGDYRRVRIYSLYSSGTVPGPFYLSSVSLLGEARLIFLGLLIFLMGGQCSSKTCSHLLMASCWLSDWSRSRKHCVCVSHSCCLRELFTEPNPLLYNN